MDYFLSTSANTLDASAIRTDDIHNHIISGICFLFSMVNPFMCGCCYMGAWPMFSFWFYFVSFPYLLMQVKCSYVIFFNMLSHPLGLNTRLNIYFNWMRVAFWLLTNLVANVLLYVPTLISSLNRIYII